MHPYWPPSKRKNYGYEWEHWYDMLAASPRLRWAVIGLLAFVLLSFCTGSRAADVRLTLGAEVLHVPGYALADLRVGEDGGYGIRVGLLRAPSWASSVPAEIRAAEPEFDLQDISYFGFDREFCGTNWCAVLGVARLSDTSWANGTQLNFLVGARYKIDRNWSLEYVHFSHGTMFGIEKDKSNRGWNFLGIGYSFR